MRLSRGRGRGCRVAFSPIGSRGLTTFKFRPMADLTLLGTLAAGSGCSTRHGPNGDALRGSEIRSRMFASDFALISSDFGARKFFRSRRLGEFRVSDCRLGGDANDGDLGMRLEDESIDDAKGSGGSVG